MTGEKRRFLRFPFNTKADFSVEGISYEVDEIINLSIGGCLLSIPVNPDPGTPCTLRINLGLRGNDPIVSIAGHIVRCDQGIVAVKFTRIDPESLLHLQKIALYNSHNPERVEQEITENPGIL